MVSGAGRLSVRGEGLSRRSSLLDLAGILLVPELGLVAAGQG